MTDTHEDILALRRRLHHLRTNGVLREACSLLLDQVSAYRFGVASVDTIKRSRAWATASTSRQTCSPEAAQVVADVLALVRACEETG